MKTSVGGIIGVILIFVLIAIFAYYFLSSNIRTIFTSTPSVKFDFILKFLKGNEEVSSIESNSQVSWILNLTNDYDVPIKDVKIVLIRPLVVNISTLVVNISTTEFFIGEIREKSYEKIEGVANIEDVPQDMKINLIVKTNFTISYSKSFKVTVVSEEAYSNKLYEDKIIGVREEENKSKSYPISISILEETPKINYTYNQTAGRDFFPLFIEVFSREKCVSNITLEITPLTERNFQMECKYGKEMKTLSEYQKSISFKIDPNSNQKVFCKYRYYNLDNSDLKTFDFKISANCSATKEKTFSFQIIKKA